MPAENPIRLSELNGRISDIIREAFHTSSFWVIADVTDHSFRSARDSHFFSLVEKDPVSSQIIAKIAGKAWGNGSVRIAEFERITGQTFTNNINVLVQVSVQFHPVYGLQLNLGDIDPNFTLGLLEQQRQATLLKLAAENPEFITRDANRFITKNNQLALNAVLQRIAIISSQTSAGAEDFKHTLANNAFGHQYVIDEYYALVQGEGNAKGLIQKMIEVFNTGIAYDVLVITRGGGAQTDFLIFDDYYIARAVAKFPIPVFTGIGHQKNETIADLMAHTALKTPTKAAEFIIAHNRSFEDRMRNLQHSIIIKSQQLFAWHRQKLTRANTVVLNRSRDIISEKKEDLAMQNRLVVNGSKTLLFHHGASLLTMSSQLLSKPKIIVYSRMNDMIQAAAHLKTAQTQYLKNQRGYLSHYVSVIKLMAPDNILKKGFAIIKTKDRVTSNPADIAVGDDIEIVLAETSIHSTVTKKEKYDGKDFNL